LRAVDPDRVGLWVGVRVYPGMPLARLALREPAALRVPGAATRDFAAPTFYLSPALGEGVFPRVGSLVGNDARFFFSDPTAAARNDNYSGDDVLVEAIRHGHRGASGDILRRLQTGLPPDEGRA
jgi:hypothetical protein